MKFIKKIYRQIRLILIAFNKANSLNNFLKAFNERND